MGEWWFGETGLPLPLGGNVVRRDLGDDLIRAISRDLRASIVYGLEHRDAALSHAMRYARGLACQPPSSAGAPVLQRSHRLRNSTLARLIGLGSKHLQHVP